MRVTFKVLDSLSTAPRPAADQDPQGPARMPPASRGPPPLGDPDRMVARGSIDPSPEGNKSKHPDPISMATSDAFVARGMSSDIDPAEVYSRDIDPEPTYEDAVDSLSKEARARTYMVAQAFFRRFSDMLRRKAAMANFVSETTEYSYAGDETKLSEPAPHNRTSSQACYIPGSLRDRPEARLGCQCPFGQRLRRSQ